MKDYLSFENDRNKRNAAVYTRLMRLALGENIQVLIGHHLTFEQGNDLATENEIPSADCLMFDHELMEKVFGDRAVEYMIMLARVPCDERDEMLGRYLTRVEVEQHA